MARRRVLHEKKEELDQKVTSEYTARLECELAMRKNLAEDFKKSQTGIKLVNIILF